MLIFCKRELYPSQMKLSVKKANDCLMRRQLKLTPTAVKRPEATKTFLF